MPFYFELSAELFILMLLIIIFHFLNWLWLSCDIEKTKKWLNQEDNVAALLPDSNHYPIKNLA